MSPSEMPLPEAPFRVFVRDADAAVESPSNLAQEPAAPAAPAKKTAAQLAEEKLDAELAGCYLSVSEKIEEPLPRLFLADKPVATEDNLVAITAKAGSGKTAAIGAAWGSAVAASVGTDADCLGFTANNINKQAVVVIDTEQARYDAQLCIKRALSRADTDEAPAWLVTVSMVGKSRSWRRKAIRRVLEKASADHEGIFAVYLDGVADLVDNVNDIEECIEVVAELRQLSIEFHCPIVSVIHSNEGEMSSDKPRGHIGSELMREAQTVIMLKKEDDAIVVTTIKQRKAPVTKEDGVAFKWSETEKRMASCGSPAVAKKQAKAAALRELARACFGSAETMSRTALEEAVGIHSAAKGNTRARRVDEMLAQVIINKLADGRYKLVRTS